MNDNDTISLYSRLLLLSDPIQTGKKAAINLEARSEYARLAYIATFLDKALVDCYDPIMKSIFIHKDAKEKIIRQLTTLQEINGVMFDLVIKDYLKQHKDKDYLRQSENKEADDE